MIRMYLLYALFISLVDKTLIIFSGKPKEEVKCRLTIDNIVSAVFYNGVKLSVSGDITNWKVVKTFSFYSVDGANLQIVGADVKSCDGCICSGLIIECSDGLTSNLKEWVAYGSDNPNAIPKLHDYTTPCKSNAGFSLKDQKSNAQKIWASNGKKYAWFMRPHIHSCNKSP